MGRSQIRRRQMSKRITRNSLVKQKKTRLGNGVETRKKLEGRDLNKFLEIKDNNRNGFLEDEVKALLWRLLVVSQYRFHTYYLSNNNLNVQWIHCSFGKSKGILPSSRLVMAK